MSISIYPPRERHGQVLSSDLTKTVAAADAQPANPWVSAWERTRSQKFVRQLVVLAASDSSVGGTFTFEYGEDGSTADISEARVITDFETVRDFDLLNAGEYFRIKFEPASALGSETVFITTTHRPVFDGQFVRLGTQEIEEANAALPQMFVYLKGFRTGGKSIGITATRGGALLMSDVGVEIARGNVAGQMAVSVHGRNPDIGTASTPEDVWLGGGAYTGFPTGTPETVDVSSASANDTSAGTGARTVRIHGLATSTSTAYTTEDLTMNGTSLVTSSGTWYRVNLVEVLTAGSGETNAGIITVHHTTTTANVFAQMAASTGYSAIAAWTVPKDSDLFIQSMRVALARASGAAGSANVLFQTRALSSSVWRSIRNYEVTNAAAVNQEMRIPIAVDEQVDIRFRVPDVSDNNTIINVEFEGVLQAE